MKSLIRFFRGQKLNRKLSFFVFPIVFIPFVILVSVLFSNMKNVIIEERLGETQRELVQIQIRLEKTAELCAMTTQFFLNSQKLRNFLLRASINDSFTSEELVTFYREDVVANFEKIVNANPYLYQVRIYFENVDLPEFFPILYHAPRMERLSWAKDGWHSGNWQYDYSDTIFPREVMTEVGNVMSLITEILDHNKEPIGVLEVAVAMNELFPNLFQIQDTSVHGFFTGSNGFVSAQEDTFWQTHGESVLSIIEENPAIKGGHINATVGGRTVIISSIAISQFDGRYIIVTFRDELTARLASRGIVFMTVAGLSLVVLAFIVDLLVKAMLKRFYRVVDTIHSVRSGNLNVEVPYVGDDEIGLLGNQVNQMLERIQILIDENVQSGLRAKNLEIRALHSQINAHFIYNVLETIKMMAEVDSRFEISDAITSLGKLLRYSMRFASENVPLKDELEHLDNYIVLMNLRYDYRISLCKNIPRHLLGQRMPKLTLQPIVENAVIHSIEEIAEDTVIDITVLEHDSNFAIKITDQGKGMLSTQVDAINRRLAEEIGEDSEGGIGLKNVHDRIRNAFGDDYGISIDSQIGVYTSVTIRLPYGEGS